MNDKENKSAFEFILAPPFKSKAIKDRFYKELNELSINHKELFDSFPDYITDVSSFLIIKGTVDGIIFDFNYKDLLTEDLEFDILNFVNSFGSPLNE
jgi:hypothetical protein